LGRLMVYVCCGSDPDYWKHVPNAKELLLKLLRSPVTREEALRMIPEDSLRYLLSNGLLKEEDGVLKLNFCVLPWEDVLRLREIGVEFGEALAKRLIGLMESFDSRLMKMRGVGCSSLEHVRFSVVGCYGLDLESLRLVFGGAFSEGFVPYAKEIREGAKRLMEDFYWGCHSSQFGPYTFYSFGNHTGRRNAFPDLVWRGKASEEEAISVAKALEEHCSKRNAENMKILEKYGYEKAPFFGPVDEEVGWKVAREVAEEAERFLRKNDELNGELKRLRASKWCRRDELLIEVWHWIFGWANNVLIREGYFARPEESEDGGRYIKWIARSTKP